MRVARNMYDVAKRRIFLAMRDQQRKEDLIVVGACSWSEKSGHIEIHYLCSSKMCSGAGTSIMYAMEDLAQTFHYDGIRLFADGRAKPFYFKWDSSKARQEVQARPCMSSTTPTIRHSRAMGLVRSGSCFRQGPSVTCRKSTNRMILDESWTRGESRHLKSTFCTSAGPFYLGGRRVLQTWRCFEDVLRRTFHSLRSMLCSSSALKTASY